MKRFFVFLFVLILLGAGAWAGFLFGKQQGRDAARAEFKSLLDIAFPPPPDEIHSLSGEVRGVFGATINLEVNHPDDYLPHVDGSPRKKELRFANVTQGTDYVLIDYTAPGASGSPKVTTLTISDIRPGILITVRSDENIRREKRFEVKRVEIVKY